MSSGIHSDPSNWSDPRHQRGLAGEAPEEPAAEEAEPSPSDEAPGDAAAEAETAEQDQEPEQEQERETSEAPSEGGNTEAEEG